MAYLGGGVEGRQRICNYVTYLLSEISVQLL